MIIRNSKLLIISGPTASGKTALAVQLAKQFNGELISADSRQIYKYLNIGTGKDHPKGTKIHLIDLITPDQSFSVAQYRQLALAKIAEIQSQNKLPILVGGSGFYIDAVINPKYSTFSVKPNFILRNILFKLPVGFLQLILRLLDINTFRRLNNSDVRNPTRLVRQIEIKLNFKNCKLNENCKLKIENYLHLSLTAPKKYLYDRIDKRVKSRLKLGHIKELKSVLKQFRWSDPGLKISAYQVFHTDDSIDQIKRKWCYAEHRDARHQLTWFKKYAHGLFIDITQPAFMDQVSDLVRKWYNHL